MLYLARLVQGITGAVVWTVDIAVIAETVGYQDVGYIMGFVTSSMYSRSFYGPMISRLLLHAFGTLRRGKWRTGLRVHPSLSLMYLLATSWVVADMYVLLSRLTS